MSRLSHWSRYICRMGVVLLFAALMFAPRTASAHAVLTSSDPADNGRVVTTPTEVRLTFSEPLEPSFSRVALHDSTGMQIPTEGAFVDPSDAYTLILPLLPQPDGLYSARWSVVSAADGHGTQGAINFVIGTSAAAGAAGSDGAIVEGSTDPMAAAMRWLNLIALSLMVGVAAYALWITPATQSDGAGTRRLASLFAAGWALTAIALTLALLLQSQQMLGATWARMGVGYVGTVVTQSRFGQLWLLRVLVWLLGGIVAWFAFRRGKSLVWVVLLGMTLLLLQSAQSHAAATPIPLAAISSDWLHLTLSTLWIGGLVALVATAPFKRGKWAQRAPFVVAFSNYARLLVLGLALTGIYATWLQVGSLDALLTTPYGNALLAKLLIMLPLLAIAASNWLLTTRSQRAGKDLWQGQLRGFLVAEIVLLVGVLAAVGVMTSTMPARTLENGRSMAEARAAAQTPSHLLALETQQDDLHLHLVITPGYVGENEFTLTLHALANHLPVVDASLIRLRFENEDQPGATSELRIESGENGAYRAVGANLSAPGAWRIRATVQRPDEFDVVADFTTPVESAPAPTPPPLVETNTPSSIALYGVTTALALILLAIGGYLIGLADVRLRSSQGGVALLFLLAGALLFIGAALG